MKPSTLVELAGLVCFVRMGFLFAPEAGWGVAGGACMFVGYTTHDGAIRQTVTRVRGVFKRKKG